MGPRRAVLPTAADFWGSTFNESSSLVKNSPPSTVTITEITEEEETAPPPAPVQEVRNEVRENVEQRLQPVATVKPMSIVTHFNRLSYASTDDSGRSSQVRTTASSEVPSSMWGYMWSGDVWSGCAKVSEGPGGMKVPNGLGVCR